jgi:Reverse transcriptase (RNA-dependent DNA polymerase)
VLTIALSKQWPLHQLDVNNIFLHENLQEVIYMQQPPEFVDAQLPDHVCLLKKALYSLKQTPRAWFTKLKSFLLQHKFTYSQADPSLFIFQNTDQVIYLLVYVDNIIIIGNNSTLIHNLLQALKENFSIKDLGTLNHFLDLEVTTFSSGILLTQTQYLKGILNKANMHQAKPCKTPLASGAQLSKTDGSLLKDVILYRLIVGALQYATITRPNITFAVNKVS